jgi:hypothetical protein
MGSKLHDHGVGVVRAGPPTHALDSRLRGRRGDRRISGLASVPSSHRTARSSAVACSHGHTFVGPRWRIQHPSTCTHSPHTVRCEYPDTDLPPTEVTFRLSPSYGLATGHEANEWFIDMLRDHDEFEVETDRAGELPVPFWSESVRGRDGGVVGDVALALSPYAPHLPGGLAQGEIGRRFDPGWLHFVRRRPARCYSLTGLLSSGALGRKA